MGPCLARSANPGTQMFPSFCCFHCFSGWGKAGAASGSGTPLHPTARQQHWCPFLRGGSSAPPLAFGSSSGSWSIRWCWGCVRDAAAAQPVASGRPRPLLGPVPKAAGRTRAAGAAPAACPCPGAGRGRAQTSHRLPEPVGDSMSSRPLLDRDTLR